MGSYQSGEPIDSMDFILDEDPFDFSEPQYGDPEYDYGMTDDGWLRPGPCPICGAPDWTCTGEDFPTSV